MIYVSMIDSVSPFDIKCEKINLRQKTFGDAVFRASRRKSFSYFLQVMGLACRSCCHIQFKPLQQLRLSTF